MTTHTENLITRLREAYKNSTPGDWQKGKTTHHTVTETGYAIGEFHHADDAFFCDQAHDLVPSLLDALQSQAERIKELEAENERLTVERDVNKRMRDQHFAELEERDNLLERLAASQKEELTLRAQLAALQSDAELPEPATWGLKDFVTRCEQPLFTAAQLRQAQAMVRAKRVPLEKEIAKDLRFHGLTLMKTSTGYAVLKLSHATAHGITGEPK